MAIPAADAPVRLGRADVLAALAAGDWPGTLAWLAGNDPDAVRAAVDEYLTIHPV
ncbi:hypothetical protein [Actinoplanes sp. NPDC026619]|uniref:hypothetical protein n=1 Tax=Actinoplanes sp. NPDC026619 TaxID=3155798 RepID=UPI003403BFDB